MIVQDLFIVLFLILIGLFWWHDRGVKQKAYLLAKRRCEQIDVQLLDQNVRLTNMKLRKTEGGPFCIERTFGFEFTVTGERRYTGTLTMHGSRLHSFETQAHQLL